MAHGIWPYLELWFISRVLTPPIQDRPTPTAQWNSIKKFAPILAKLIKILHLGKLFAYWAGQQTGATKQENGLHQLAHIFDAEKHGDAPYPCAESLSQYSAMFINHKLGRAEAVESGKREGKWSRQDLIKPSHVGEWWHFSAKLIYLISLFAVHFFSVRSTHTHTHIWH